VWARARRGGAEEQALQQESSATAGRLPPRGLSSEECVRRATSFSNACLLAPCSAGEFAPCLSNQRPPKGAHALFCHTPLCMKDCMCIVHRAVERAPVQLPYNCVTCFHLTSRVPVCVCSFLHASCSPSSNNFLFYFFVPALKQGSLNRSRFQFDAKEKMCQTCHRYRAHQKSPTHGFVHGSFPTHFPIPVLG